MKSGIIILISFFLFACNIYGQENISFEHFTSENGLSAPVTHIVQDRYGFLWLGTTDGLNRFDGKNFKVYRNQPHDSSSLCNNIINHLCLDSSGTIWAATNGGLCYYDFSRDAFHTINTNEISAEEIDDHRIYGATAENDGTIWYASRTLLHKWKDNKTETIKIPFTENFQVDFLYADEHGHIWVGVNNNLFFLYDKAKKIFFKTKINSPFAQANKITTSTTQIIYCSKDTVLMSSWNGGLQKVYFTGDTIFSIPFSDHSETDPRSNIATSICRTNDSLWWLSTYGTGLSLFNYSTGNFIRHFHHNESDSRTLSNDYINELYKDVSGILWIGTNSGLDKYDPFAQQFQTVTIPVDTNAFSIYRLPSSFIEDRNDPAHQWLWMTVSGAGLYHFNRFTKEFKLYKHNEKDSYSLPDDNVYSLYYDHKNRLWIGSRTGTWLFNERDGKFTKPPFQDNTVPERVHDILQDKLHRFWVSSSSIGVFCWDEPNSKLISYRHEKNNPNSLPDNRVFCMLEDHEGKIWIGTQSKGLCRLDPETGKFIFFQYDRNNPKSLPDNGVYDLFEDENHHLWIAMENGLAEMNLRDYSMKVYTTLDGLCNNDVFSIGKDKRNHFWLATNNGICDFDPQQRTFKNYYMNDGLPFNAIDGAVYCCSDGTMLFGCRGMIAYCNPETMKMNKRIPPVVITEFKIFGKQVPVIRDAEMIQPIQLSFKQNMLTFEFAAMNFTNAGRNQYAYKMEGFDRDWILCGNRQSATYTNLNGGSYTFRVKAANNDGTWNEEGTFVKLVVSPPYWKTWWFYLLCTVAIAAILYSIYRMRINQLLQLQHIRMRIARDLHDDIGSTLSSINMISSMANKSTVAEKKSTDLFSTISSASRQAMELMNDIVWSINPKNDRMEMMLIRMRQYAGELLEAAHISFTIEMDEQCNNILLAIEKRKDFYLIFKEAINNLAKYSHASEANIKMNCVNRMLILIVTDNGIGFSLENGSSRAGNGLKNMQARAELLKGKIKIISDPGKGTQIDLRIPLSP